MQGNEQTMICDGSYNPNRPLDTTALPVQIYNPIFEQFSSRINDPTFEPDESTIATVALLAAETSKIRHPESNAFSALRPLLTKLLGRDVGQVPSSGSRTPDGLVYKMIRESRVPLVCIEYKRALGEGGCDPSVQAAYSVRDYLVLEKVCDFRVFLHPVDTGPV